MTDRTPELVAADLTPVSPRPIHPPSPILLPAIQDQADAYFAMSINHGNGADAAPAAAPDVAAGEPVQIPTQVDPAIGDTNPDIVVTDSGDAATAQQSVVQAQEPASGAVAAAAAQHHETAKPDADAVAEVQGGAKEVVGDAAIVEAAAEGPVDGQQHVSKANDTNQATSDASEPSLTSLPTVTSQSSEGAPPSHVLSADNANADTYPQTAPGIPSQPEPAPASEQSNAFPPASVLSDANGAAQDSSNGAIDIQALVDSITARNAALESAQQPPQPPSTTSDSSNANSNLPPRPPMPQQTAGSSVLPEELRNIQPGLTYPNAPSIPSAYPPVAGAPYAAAAPGTVPTSAGNLPPPPSSTFNAMPNQSIPVPPYDMQGAPYAGNAQANYQPQQTYDDFLQDERKYVSEARWDRFPEGSRLFIGNLSSERVNKREVFDIFGKYGRLAQISLKQAYGFVQYHTVAEGQAAMENLQNMEIKGRRVHLEISRTQKKDNDGERRNKGRDRDRERKDDHYDGRGRQRDDYRPGRRSPPRQNDHRRQDSYGRDRDAYDASFDRTRGRSRSPDYGGRDANYRRRTPSPYRRQPSEADLEIPRRYGGDIPDVQFLLLQEVDRDFTQWVQRHFTNHGLRVDVMFLNPRFPRDAVIQRQVVEGVHAVSELDFRAQQTGRIPLQVFDRSAGRNNVRFDQYQDLEPNIAAQLVLRTKSSAAATVPYGQYPPAQGYGQPAPPYQQPPASSYPGQPPLPAGNGMGQLDHNSVQKILASLQNSQQGPGMQGQPPATQVDVNALLATLGRSSQNAAPGPVAQPPSGYAPGPAPGAPGPPVTAGGNEQYVQDIMAQLARYRQ